MNSNGLTFVFVQPVKDKLPKYCGNIVDIKNSYPNSSLRYNVLSRELLNVLSEGKGDRDQANDEVQCLLPYKPLKTDGGAASEEEKKELKIPVSVGLDYVNFCPITVDLGQSHVIAIYGKRDYGKTNLLCLLLEGLLRQKTDLRFVFLDDGRKQLEDIKNRLGGKAESEYFNGYQEGSIKLGAAGSRGSTAAPKPEETITRKLSPLQKFYLYLNENYLQVSKKIMGGIFGITSDSDCSRINCRKDYPETPFTVFIIQSKLVYLNTLENKHFIEKILPQMAAVAEEKGYLFIFSDVQKINEPDTNTVFNNMVSAVFLLDNIAEFAGERGQRTVFGNMDVKALKEDYARCEKGDGYLKDFKI